METERKFPSVPGKKKGEMQSLYEETRIRKI
jgi:hypothetical protein